MTRPPPPRSTRGRREKASALLGSVVAGKYRLEEVIGLGGTGAVYRAEDVVENRSVAVKILFPDADGFALLATRMEREALAGSHLRHENIAAALDFGVLPDDSRYLVIEFVPGRTLREVMNGGPLSLERALPIAVGLARAIGACHARGIVHRDIKPLNVMIDEAAGDKVKLIDFGLARIPMHEVSLPPTDGDGDEAPTVENLTTHGIVFGTVAYMAPETAQGMAAVDARSDLYAFGVLLYELFAGVHPFATKDPVDLFLQHRVTQPPAMRERAPAVSVPDGIEPIAMRLLAKNPADRYPDAESVIAALHATTHSTVRAASAPALPRSKRITRAGIAVCAAAAAVLAVLFAVPRAPAPDRPLQAIVRSLRAPPAPTSLPAEAPRGEAEALRFRSSFELQHWQPATDALRALLAADPGALTDEEDRKRARQTALRAAFSELKGADALFDALAEDAGDAGIEVLYEIIEGRGGSRGATMAWDRLKRPAVRERVSPALDVALSLRLAACKEKASLFEQAGRVGDARARRVLVILRAPTCKPHRGECCYGRHQALSRALEAIEAREDAAP